MTADTLDRSRAETEPETSPVLDPRRQVRFLLNGSVEFPGLVPELSEAATESLDPVGDVQNLSDAASPMPAPAAIVRKKRRKTDVPLTAVLSPDTATQLAASDPSSFSPHVRVKTKKKVQPEDRKSVV